MTTRIYVLLGGFFPGPDGWLTSSGMLGLASSLARLPGTVVKTYQWSSYQDAGLDIQAHKTDPIVVIGYSGGGSRATWLANLPYLPRIDLMILYDPSPRWQMKAVGANVRRAITYQNPKATMPSFYGWLGGGVLVGPNVERVPISKNHAIVQFDAALHDRTIAEVKKLLAVG